LRTSSARKYAAWTSAVVAVVGVASTFAATPAIAKTVRAPKAVSSRIAPGVTFNRTNFTLHEGKKKYREEAVTLSVTLSSRTSLVAAYPGNKVSGHRATLTSLAKQEHAVGGVSGNVFLVKDRYAAGDGGISHQGSIVKSELKGKDDSLWVDAAGHAHIGDPGFDGYLFTTAHHHKIHISSVNYVDNASKGAVTVLDYHQSPVPLPSCFVATLASVGKNAYRVQSVYHHATRFGGVTGSTKALVTCGPHNTPWLSSVLAPGVQLTGSWGYARSVTTLVSGTNHIVRNGKPYHDPRGIPASIDTYQKKRVPVDFACVKSNDRQVLLGSIIGWKPYAAGMTYAELSSYLVRLGCRDAIALNAQLQSALVAARPGHPLAQQNPVARTGEAKQVSGLLVTTR
jgi:hypothetical protein